MSTLPLEPMPLTASPMPVSAVYVGHSAVIRMRFERYSDGAALRVNISTPDLVAAYMGWWGIGHSPPAEATAPPNESDMKLGFVFLPIRNGGQIIVLRKESRQNPEICTRR